MCLWDHVRPSPCTGSVEKCRAFVDGAWPRYVLHAARQFLCTVASRCGAGNSAVGETLEGREEPVRIPHVEPRPVVANEIGRAPSLCAIPSSIPPRNLRCTSAFPSRFSSTACKSRDPVRQDSIGIRNGPAFPEPLARVPRHMWPSRGRWSPLHSPRPTATVAALSSMSSPMRSAPSARDAEFVAFASSYPVVLQQRRAEAVNAT